MNTQAVLIRELYSRSRLRGAVFIIAAIVVLAAFSLLSLCVGSSGMLPREVLRSLFVDTGEGHSIVWMLRLPRVVMGTIVGFGLGVAGCVFQAILRNPLASPYTLGVGSGAGFGAVAVIILGGGALATWHVAAGAFLFSMVSALFILGIARMKKSSTETMILAGIAQMFLFSSLTSLFQYMGTMEQVHEVVFWFFGSLSKPGWKEAGLAALMVFVPLPFLIFRSLDLNLLSTGDESAISLGVNVERLRMGCVVCASLVTAGGICFTGVVGFVGLVAPHMTRMVIGNDHRVLLPASGLSGAVLVVAADTLGRVIWAPQVIPIGIMTSFVGVPFFFYLLMRRTREYW